MRILVAHNQYAFTGGEDRVVESEIDLLRREGNVVEIFSRNNNDVIQKGDIGKKLAFFLRDGFYAADVYREVQEKIRFFKPDLVHLHNPFYMFSPSFYEAVFDLGVPLVQTLHNYRFICPVGTFFRNGRVCQECIEKDMSSAIKHGCWKNSYMLSFWLVQLIKKYKEKNILQRVSKFIALSQFSKDVFVSNGFQEKRVTVKPNFVDLKFKEDVQKEDFVLFAGALQPYKGLNALMKAFEFLDNIPLKIVGDGPLKSDVEQFATRKPNVDFLGWKDFDDLIDIMRRAKLLVLPTECFENFPRSIVEAFACGTPVLASNIGAIKEIIEEGKTGVLFEPGNAEDLKNKIMSLYEQESHLKNFASCCINEYKLKYSSQKNYQQLCYIYEQVLNG